MEGGGNSLKKEGETERRDETGRAEASTKFGIGEWNRSPDKLISLRFHLPIPNLTQHQRNGGGERDQEMTRGRGREGSEEGRRDEEEARSEVGNGRVESGEGKGGSEESSGTCRRSSPTKKER